MKKMNGNSINPNKIRIDKLKELFPDSLTYQNKINFNKLKEILSRSIENDPERYELLWSGKQKAIKEANLPSKGALLPDKKRSKDWDNTKNIYIEGDNLEVLKLLQRAYFNKIKVIYIDPPYNNGHDYVYKDNYKNNIKSYLRQTGQISNNGHKLTTNSENSGRFHTRWLTMMYPRLKLSRSLLSKDGIIFVSIDDNELTNLTCIMNEIFGENNKLADLIWTNKEGGGSSDTTFFRIKHEHILCYAKSADHAHIRGIHITNKKRYKKFDKHVKSRGKYYLQKLGQGSIHYSGNLDYPLLAPDNHTKVYPKDNNHGKKACWRWSKKKVQWGIKHDFIVAKKDKNGQWTFYTKQYLKMNNDGKHIVRTQRPMGIIDKFSSTQATKELKAINFERDFSYPKPVSLIRWLIDRVVNKHDIVMDFFSGSGTTAQAVMEDNLKYNRQNRYILIQLPEIINKNNVGNNSTALQDGFKTIPDIAEKRISLSGNMLSKKHPNVTFDKGFRVFKLSTSNLIQWNNDPTKLIKQLNIFKASNGSDILSGRSKLDVIYELLLKKGFGLTASIHKIVVNKMSVYSINNGYLYIILGPNIDVQTISNFVNNYITKDHNLVNIIFEDNAFINDSSKINTFEFLNNSGFNSSNILSI